MAPERSPKRQKTSEDHDAPAKTAQPSAILSTRDHASANITSGAESSSQSTPRSSFFSSWSKSGPPIAQVARESIKSAGNVASDVASSIKDIPIKPRSMRSPSLAMTLGRGKATRASLADVTTTMVHAEAKSPARKPTRSSSASIISERPSQQSMPKEEDPKKPPKSEVTPEDPPAKIEESTMLPQKDLEIQRSSWLGWMAKGEGATSSSSQDVPKPVPEVKPESSKDTAEEALAGSIPQDIQSKSVQGPSDGGQTTRRSWLPLWNSDTSEQAKDRATEPESAKVIDTQQMTEAPQKQSLLTTNQDSTSKLSEMAATFTETSPPPALPHDSSKPSAWAFWSRDRPTTDSSSTIDRPRDGEIAISNTATQTQPTKASLSVPKTKDEGKPDPKKPEPKQPESRNPPIVAKDETSGGNEDSDGSVMKGHRKKDSKATSGVKAESFTAKAIVVPPAEDMQPTSTKPSQTDHNLLLPNIYTTLKTPETPSLLIRLASMLYAPKEPDTKHLFLVKDVPRIKDALAIGVHGYFPIPLIRSVLGQPTGTSIKFADMAAKSIKKWTAAHGYECRVKSAALEGEGKIADRVELLWKLLLNWIEDVRKSDFILIACHSQGVPVAIMLVAKLIQFGCVSSSAKVCVCAMAGVNMGPFPEYKSRWIGGSAGELFEFSNPASRVSTDYLAALEIVLKFGVRVTFVGSIDDQLVSLESSIFSPITHPHVFRAVSIDAKVHAPNFLSHLVGFALKLRNLGVQDHGLIRELSSPLAGSLYTSEGHSRIYEDDAVYDLAVSFAMETTTLAGIPIAQKTIVSGGSNPYILPFAMRGILEEDLVKTELQKEVDDLLKEFDDWKPVTKALKDVKFRLEGIRSRL